MIDTTGMVECYTEAVRSAPKPGQWAINVVLSRLSGVGVMRVG